jgi:DNA (cytosine-5)-methyltransferase 3A
MNVLSLFDGMSCGQQALDRLRLDFTYYASEVDKAAIKVTTTNYPNTIHLGDVRNLDVSTLPKIDLLIGGSPCQNFSFAGKQQGATTKSKIEINSLKQYLKLKKEGFEFIGQSYLFWEYMRILTELKKINPKIIFLLENVLMAEKWKNILSTAIGVKPIEIDSKLVSAQTRRRLYWTNLEVEQPEDKHIYLNDILEDKTFLNKASIIGRRLKDGVRKDYDKTVPITQCLEVRASNRNKCNCLTTVAKDNVLTNLPIGRHPGVYTDNLPYRNYTPTELEALQTVKRGYTSCVSDSQRVKMLGNGWTVDVISHILKDLQKIFL